MGRRAAVFDIALKTYDLSCENFETRSPQVRPPDRQLTQPKKNVCGALVI